MSAQDYDREALENFFSAYFHEDWPCEAPTPVGVVENYLRSAKATEVARLRSAILRYAEKESDNAALERKLLTELGCYYRPSADGHTAKNWLHDLAALMEKTN